MVDLGEGGINNIITQSAVVHMLAECTGLQWFESLGMKKLSELGLPLMKSSHVVKVFQPFSLLKKGVVTQVEVKSINASSQVL